MTEYKFTFNQEEKIIQAKCMIRAIKKFKLRYPEVRSYTVSNYKKFEIEITTKNRTLIVNDYMKGLLINSITESRCIDVFDISKNELHSLLKSKGINDLTNKYIFKV